MSTSKPERTGPPVRGGKRRRVGKVSSQKRQDSYRTEQNERYLKSDQCTVGRDAMDRKFAAMLNDLPGIKTQEVSPSQNTSYVPIALRGVGASVAVAYSAAVALAPAKVVATCSIHAAFRAVLAQATYRLAEACVGCKTNPLSVPDMVHPFMSEELSSVVRANTETFALSANVLHGIGWFEHAQGVFQTFLPAVDEGNLTERSAFRVIATTLRNVCVHLANPEAAHRQAFVACNSIPGAVFNAANVLQNLNAVVPERWPTRALLLADFVSLNGLLGFLKSKAPHLVGSISYSGGTRPLALISRSISVRGEAGAITEVNQDGRAIYVVGIPFDSTYYSSHHCDKTIILRGVLTLLGETFVGDNLAARNKSLAVQSATVSWDELSQRAVHR